MSWDGRMHTTTSGTYDEALDRFHRTGPEFDGWLSNHGPMVVEILSRRGSEGVVHAWTEDYSRRLEPLPRSTYPITEESAVASLGDHRRLADWVSFFEVRVAEGPWAEVLATWWPLLLPGIVAGATHGVIRVGHAVESLRAEDNDVRRRELAHGLGYWAARWQPVMAPAPRGSRDASDLVTTVPRVALQEGGIRDRLAQLTVTDGWAEHEASLRAPETDEDVVPMLDALVDAVVMAYPRVAVGNPTMLVHAATAPHAVARAVPSLPQQLWRPSFDAAWAASSAVLSAYRPAVVGEDRATSMTADDVWRLAVDDGGEHVVKLADSALAVHARTQDPRALAAITTAIELEA
jgi:hypothetical protein